jgi:hypothetical protein
MSRTRHLSAPVLVLTLATYFLVPSCPLAQEPGRSTSYSTNPSDLAACRRQLNVINGAIQEYRALHCGALPERLSDLAQELLSDPNILICPYVQFRGGLRLWKKRFSDWASDAHTSYSYELSTTPLTQYHWRGYPKATWRQFKERQSAELGSLVPIVRCLDHRPCLNLAMNGSIYESAEYWERNFSQDDHLLTVGKLFKVPTTPVSEQDFAPRGPRANPRLLDLTHFYNATLTNSWQGFPGNHLRGLPSGVQEFDGIPFDVRGVIQLGGTELPADFPSQVGGIRVGQKCVRIHFLHALSFEYKTGTVQASYFMHYSTGVVEEFRIVYGHDIIDWWHEPGRTASPTNAVTAWTGQNEASKAYGMATSLYHTTWENPRKDTEIATITIDAGTKQYLSGPFVVAITLE